MFLNKSAPSPRFRTNVYLQYDLFSGKLEISDAVNDKLTKLDNMLSGVNEYVNVDVMEIDTDIE